MRQLADIAHPEFKVTLFAWNNKYLLKFEDAWVEQTYKVGQLDLTSEADAISLVHNETFINHVRETFITMRTNWQQALAPLL